MPIIQTASKVVDKFDTDRHGFTDGDPQAGVPPTQISPEWCDGVQEEINNVIVWGEQTIDSNGPYTGMKAAVTERIREQVNATSLPTTYRNSNLLIDEPEWCIRQQTVAYQGVPKNFLYTGGISLPNNCQAALQFTVIVTSQTTLINRAIWIFDGAARQVAGTCVMEASVTRLVELNMDVSASLVASGASALVQLVIENTCPDEEYNILITAWASTVTTAS